MNLVRLRDYEYRSSLTNNVVSRFLAMKHVFRIERQCNGVPNTNLVDYMTSRG